MKKILLSLLIAVVAFATNAQELPKPSPLGELEQVVGVTTVTLNYSRPGVKGRTVFGDLVPLGELWRLGANACTKITTTHELNFDGNKLPKGTYAMFAIPGKETWEIIFNKDIEQGGTADYDQEKDVFRVKVPAVRNSFTETLTLEFDEIKNGSANIVILWENMKVTIPFTVNTDAIAQQNIEDAISKGENLADVFNNAANYYFSSKEDIKMANSYVDQSIKIEKNFRNLFLKARIAEKNGSKEQAIQYAKEALILAKEADHKGYVQFIEGTIAKWEGK